MREELGALVRDAAPRLAGKPAEEPAGESPAGESPAGEGEAPPREGASLHSALERARERGESALALAIVRRLLDIDPDDVRARQVADEIEGEGREAEAEQLCAIALAYAADGEVEKAAEIAEKIERLSPWSPRYLQLQVYLDEEAARRNSEGLAVASRERLEAGDLQGALASAEEALALFPMHRIAQEVRDRARAGLDAVAAAAADHSLAQDLEAALQDEAKMAGPRVGQPAPSLEPGEVPGPPPSGHPAPATTATRGPTDPGDVAGRPTDVVAEGARSPAPASAAQAGDARTVDGGAGDAESGGANATRHADIEILTSAALDRFLQNDHAGAQRAASMVLELDPRNRKARELLKILGALRP
jgi:tetratricopeptide (TPR) repeat protein